MIKKYFILILSSCFLFGDDADYTTLKGEYKYMPSETSNENCYCNFPTNDVINFANIIPFETKLNKEISQTIIDTKNLDTILKREWANSLAFDSKTLVSNSSVIPVILEESKKISDLNLKKTQKMCVDLDLEINNINNNIIAAELKLAELKSKIGK